MEKDIKRDILSSEYKDMQTKRESWLEAAKISAKYTIPAIMPDDVSITKSGNSKAVLKQPNQSVGADGINNLSAKVALTLMPPNQPFFRFKMDSSAIDKASQSLGVEKHTLEEEINQGLAKLESLLLDYIESSSDRVCLGEAFKHLYITGNVLLVRDIDLGLKYYPLSRYVIKRDYHGNIQKVITEEKIGFLDLPDYIQTSIMDKYEAECDKENKEEQVLQKKEFVLYTGFKRLKNKWEIWQEVEGFVLEKTAGSYPIDVCPVIPLRYVRIDGEDYGRGLVEEYIGDISYLDTICLAIKQAALAGAKLIMLVNPSGTTSIRKLSTAKNGDFVAGKAEDVTPLQANKYYDLQTAQAEADKIERRLNRIFVMKAAIQRDAERVTAEEIRQMAADLEEALGNHYSLMAKEFQLAYIKLVYYQLRKKKSNLLPDLIKSNDINLTVTTGLEALSKTSDLNKLITFFDVCGKLAQSAQILGAKTEPLLNKVASSLNIDIEGMFYTEEEKQQMQAQAQQVQLLQNIAPNVVNKAGEAIMQQGGETQ